MKVPEPVKKEAMALLVQVFGIREAGAMIRALEEDLFGAGQQAWTPDAEARWKEAINSILAEQPLAYITGVSHFLNLRLKVNSHVLIPRPETEELAVMGIDLLKSIKQPRVLDIGTGSGCLALAIKSSCPGVMVYALDIDSAVLETARSNAADYHLDIDFRQVDFLDEKAWPGLPGNLDLIISNPPYIGETEKMQMSASTLKHEPPLALFAGPDPLVYYRKIARFGKERLKAGGRIMVEINEYRGAETADVFRAAGYPEIEIHRDLSGKERIVVVSNQ